MYGKGATILHNITVNFLRNTILPTIETCFNCFWIRSSDANRNNKKTTKPTGKFKSYATSLDPPPPPWRGRGSWQKWRQCLKEKFFSLSFHRFVFVDKYWAPTYIYPSNPQNPWTGPNGVSQKLVVPKTVVGGLIKQYVTYIFHKYLFLTFLYFTHTVQYYILKFKKQNIQCRKTNRNSKITVKNK